MRRFVMLTITMLALTSFMAITALAQNAHFLSCGASGVNADGSLNVSFKIAGLGNNVTLTVTASATADAVYGCLNGGETMPQCSQ
jgi:cytochrome c-type biogenesis protein CcmE